MGAFARLCSSSSRLRWTTPTELELTLSAPVRLGVLRQMEAANINAQFAVGSPYQKALDGGSDVEIPSGTVVGFRVPRVIDNFVVARDLADLLSLPGAAESAPGEYVLCADQEGQGGIKVICSSQDPAGAPPEIRRYHEAVKLWRLLLGRAEHQDAATNALLFFGLRRTEILPGFNTSDLKFNIWTDEIREFIQSPDANRVRLQIFSSALSEFLRDQNNGSAFPYLLRTSEHFARRLREGMAVHLAENSPEKLALEGQKSALEFSEKLEKVVSGLETKSLAIPVALLLSVKDIQAGAGVTTLNAMLVLSVLLFAVTMTLVHLSQHSVLEMLRASLENITTSLKMRGLEAKNPVIHELFEGLKKRRNTAHTASWVMCFAAWVPLALVVFVAFFADPKHPVGLSGPSSAPIGRTK